MDAVLKVYVSDQLPDLVQLTADRSSSRVGWYLEGIAVQEALGIEHIERITLVDGLLGGTILIEGEVGNPFHWYKGILLLWRKAVRIPKTVVRNMDGSALGDMVTHRCSLTGLVVNKSISRHARHRPKSMRYVLHGVPRDIGGVRVVDAGWRIGAIEGVQALLC